MAWEVCSINRDTVRLNGPFGMELGTAEDVQNWDFGDTIGSQSLLRIQGIQGDVGAVPPSDEALYLDVKARPVDTFGVFSTNSRMFTYLCAERLGPRSVLGAARHPANELEVGVRGEYCAQVIERLGNKQLDDENRLHPDRDDGEKSLLKYEVEKWLERDRSTYRN